MQKPQRILVPVDFSEFSPKAVSYAANYAELFGAELLIQHVYQAPLYPESMGFHDTPQPGLGEVHDKLAASMRSILEEVAGDKDVKHRVIVSQGTPYVEIVQLAEDEKADLIVMPTRGRGGLAQFLVGSTAERVVRKGPCPVLVLHDSDF